MRKQSVIIAVLAVFAMTMMLSACGISTTVSKLQSVSVDVENAKTEFFTGEEFTADGIKVTAEIKMANSNTPTIKTLSASEYEVNSDSYNKFQPGKYTIKVSYTYDGETKTATYDVTVGSREYDGISVQLKDGVEDTYHLTSPVEIDTAAIVVKQTDQFGNLLDDVATGYTTSLYKGKEEVALEGGKATITEGGAYQIWVEKPSTVQPFYTLKAFVTVYVLDDVLTLTFDETAEGTLTTQEEGSDEISETWQFTVTYESGKTKTVSAKDVDFTVKPDTSVAGENLTASATYTEKNAKSESATTSEATVTYTVTEKQAPSTEPIVNNFSMPELIEAMTAALGAAPADKTALKAEYFTGANAFLTLGGSLGGSDQYRTSSGGCFELKKGTLSVTFQNTGTLTVAFASTGGSNKSRLALLDGTGAIVPAKETTATLVADGVEDGSYEVQGTSFVPVTFEITAPGTYTICSMTGVTGRGMRINAISMTDAPAQASVIENTFSMQELVDTMTAALGAAPADKTALTAGYFTGANAFLTLGGSLGGSDQYRTSSGGCFELKKGTLSVTFQNTGTLTVAFASTGGSNKSRLALLDGTGAIVPAKETTATLVADGVEDGSYEVQGTTFVPVTFEITTPGTYTICSKTGVTGRGMRINAISMIDSPVQATVDTFNFSMQELVDSMTAALGATPTDKTALKADYFTGANAFLTLGGSLGGSDQYRTSSGGCFELKKGTLSVTFQGTGTLTVAFASTGGSNNSRLAVKDSTGAMLVAKETTAAAVTDAEAGAYEVQGTTFVTVSFEITQPGTYTICSMTGVTGRGMRVNAISMTDNH